MTKSLNARASIKLPESNEIEWFSFSTSPLQSIVDHFYKNKSIPNKAIENIEEETLNEAILKCEGMQLLTKKDTIHKIVFN